LYRRGRATPLEVDTRSYTNLYDLNLVRGHWLVSRVAAVDGATAARLAAARRRAIDPPHGLWRRVPGSWYSLAQIRWRSGATYDGMGTPLAGRARHRHSGASMARILCHAISANVYQCGCRKVALQEGA
jgi:hypothetical protein